jgi:hypothetical protein
MARTKSTAASHQRESEHDSQEAGRQAIEDSEPDTPRKMSKTDAIRAAVAEGHESPGDGVDFIKKRFGIELSKQHFSATKSKLKTTGAGQSKEATRVAAPSKKKAARVEGYLAPPEQPAGGEGNLLDALEAIKPLIAQHGAESVKRMVDLLG